MKKIKAFYLTFILFFGLILILPNKTLFAQKDLFEKKVFISEAGGTIPYRFLIPENSTSKSVADKEFEGNWIFDNDNTKEYPLIIFLHGAGERGTDNEIQLAYIDKVFGNSEFREKHPCYVIAPQCPKENKWVEVSWSLSEHIQPETPSIPLQLTIELIDEIIENYPVDESRIYVTGLSMGGFGTWDLLSRFPDKFAGGIPICGGGDENNASKISQIPIWAFHGATDRVVMVERSRNMIEAIKNNGGSPKYTEFPTLGHLCWTQAYATEGLFEWLFKQVNEK